MSYAREYILRLEDTDANYNITNKSILALMENTSDEDSAKYDVDIRTLNKRGQSWVIVEWNLEVYSRAKYGDKVRVETWPREVNSRFIWRDFVLYRNDEKIAAASSKWMIVDLVQKTTARITQAEIDKYPIEDRCAISTSDSKRLRLLDDYDSSHKIVLRKSDMDLNGHMHNLSYLDLADEIGNANPQKERIVFHREIKLSDSVIVKSKTIDCVQHLAIVNEKDEVYSFVEKTT